MESCYKIRVRGDRWYNRQYVIWEVHRPTDPWFNGHCVGCARTKWGANRIIRAHRVLSEYVVTPKDQVI